MVLFGIEAVDEEFLFEIILSNLRVNDHKELKDWIDEVNEIDSLTREKFFYHFIDRLSVFAWTQFDRENMIVVINEHYRFEFKSFMLCSAKWFDDFVKQGNFVKQIEDIPF